MNYDRYMMPVARDVNAALAQQRRDASRTRVVGIATPDRVDHGRLSSRQFRIFRFRKSGRMAEGQIANGDWVQLVDVRIEQR